MSNDLTIPNTNATLLDMRMDAKRFPRIGKVSREDAIVLMSKVVTEAYLYKGQNADITNVRYIASALVDELQSDMDNLGTRNISFAEIARIVKRAILTEEMFGISVASLFKVILEYIKGEGHELQVKVREMRSNETQRQMRDSVVAPMLQAYAGKMLKNNKV